MRVTGKIPFAVRNIALAVALATVGTQAGATLVADGKFEGIGAGLYQYGVAVGFTLQNKISKKEVTGTGMLYFGTQAAPAVAGTVEGSLGNQFLYFQFPTELVDNTYGTTGGGNGSDPSWVTATGKAHTFGNLDGSDSLGSTKGYFGWGGDNADNNQIRIDYITACTTATCGGSGSSAYRSGGVTEGEGDVNQGSAADILQIATSLEYNLNQVVNNTSISQQSNASWIKEVGYEIEFKKDTFVAADWQNPAVAPGLITLGEPHVSPAKNLFVNYTPEPGTPWLLGMGLVALGWFARRRKEDPPDCVRGVVPS